MEGGLTSTNFADFLVKTAILFAFIAAIITTAIVQWRNKIGRQQAQHESSSKDDLSKAT